MLPVPASAGVSASAISSGVVVTRSWSRLEWYRLFSGSLIEYLKLADLSAFTCSTYFTCVSPFFWYCSIAAGCLNPELPYLSPVSSTVLVSSLTNPDVPGSSADVAGTVESL
jgi:hypothetical protein